MNVLLASRNLLRNRRRSLATLLALTIGSTSILLFGGYSKNIELSMQTAYVRTGGHLQIQRAGFFQFGSGDPTSYGISGYEEIIEEIRRDEGLKKMVLVMTPALQFGGIAGNYAEGVSRTIFGQGLVAQDQRQMRDWNEFDLLLTYPPFPLEGTPPDSALVGTGLARVLRLCEGLKVTNCSKRQVEPAPSAPELPSDVADLAKSESAPATAPNRIEVLASNSRGTPNVTAVQVIAADQQGFKELDDVYVAMHLRRAQQLVYGSSPPQATSIMLQLRLSEQIDAARERIYALLAKRSGQSFSVLDFRTLNPFYVQTQLLFDTIFGFIFGLIGSIVLFTIGNTMNMAVAERTVEIGTLRAIGMRRGDIRRLFVVEGMLLGIIGALVGLALALAISFAVNQSGLTWLPPGSALPLPLTLIIWGQFKMMLGTTVGLILIATLSAWWPARRAAKLVIVDALRHA